MDISRVMVPKRYGHVFHPHTRSRSCSCIVVTAVGQPKFSIETHAPPGLPADIIIRRFPDLISCRDFVHARSGKLVGIEIVEGARNVDEEPFSVACAFMPGNEVSLVVDFQVCIKLF